jgi:hypothetical protein
VGGHSPSENPNCNQRELTDRFRTDRHQISSRLLLGALDGRSGPNEPALRAHYSAVESELAAARSPNGNGSAIWQGELTRCVRQMTKAA